MTLPMTMPSLPCPLCTFAQAPRFAEVSDRLYFRCDRCRLIFLDPEQQPAPETARAHYDLHENDPADPRYRAFLDQLAAPLVDRLRAGDCGLDYGSGPGPTLSIMLQERGFPTDIYDPFYAPERSVLERKYDFIACTEVVEHFSRPAVEFDRLNRMLQPGGWLGIMTQMRDDSRPFQSWRYVQDPTHIAFYHADTMRWLALRFGWVLENPIPNPAVNLFYKPSKRDLTRSRLPGDPAGLGSPDTVDQLRRRISCDVQGEGMRMHNPLSELVLRPRFAWLRL
ncbi:hypothetical protein BH23PLA1_BH23PLA1_22360 [soil metagenome]